MAKKKCLKEAEEGTAKSMKNKITESKNDYLEEWQKIVDAKDLDKALIDHFSYLADTPGYNKVLEGVMKEAVSAKINEDCLFIEFPSDTLIATPPTDLQHHLMVLSSAY